VAILADGQVDISKATIFEVTGADVLNTTNAIVDKITLFNTNSTKQTALLYIQKFSETSRELRQFQLKQNEGGEYLEPGEMLELENGDVLQAETTTAAAVDFVVFGTRL